MPRAKVGKGGSIKTERNPFSKRTEASEGPLLKDSLGLGHAIDSLLARQCAIILSRTRDGGSVCLTILDDEQRHRTYCSNQAELDAAVAAISEMFG